MKRTIRYLAAGLLLASFFFLPGCREQEEMIDDAQEAAEEFIPTQRITLMAVGDLMVHAPQLEAALDPETGGYDFSGCFSAVEADLREGYAVGNLETVLGGSGPGYRDYPLFNSPDSFAAALAASGFDLLGTANNHCLDQGTDGLLRTLEVLDDLGLTHTGTFADPASQRFYVEEIDGIRVAFLACTAGVNDSPEPPPGMVNLIREEDIADELYRARQQADLIVVMPHLGREMEAGPDPAVREFTDFLIQNGADVVLGSHPHVLQPMEIRRSGGKQALVIYSLGNFISSQREEPADAGIILKLDFARQENGRVSLEAVRIVPTWVQFRDSLGSPLIRVVPVQDAIERYAELAIHPEDLQRLQRAREETAALYLEGPPPENAREFTVYP